MPLWLPVACRAPAGFFWPGQHHPKNRGLMFSFQAQPAFPSCCLHQRCTFKASIRSLSSWSFCFNSTDIFLTLLLVTQSRISAVRSSMCFCFFEQCNSRQKSQQTEKAEMMAESCKNCFILQQRYLRHLKERLKQGRYSCLPAQRIN